MSKKYNKNKPTLPDPEKPVKEKLMDGYILFIPSSIFIGGIIGIIFCLLIH